MKYYLVTLLSLFPMITLAEIGPRNFRDVVTFFLRFIDILVVLVFAITFIVLAWGIVNAWILNPGNESEIEKGKNIALYGILVLVVMSGIWGILALLRRSIFGM